MFRKLFIIMLLAIFTTGCAQQAAFVSTPPGAQVYVDGKEIGVTPCAYDYKLSQNESHEVTIVKEGFEPVDFVVVADEVDKEARSRALSLLSQGAGLVTFTGHANHWVWARLGEIAGYDYRLFGLWDVSSLANYDELFIGLSMTCLSAEFSEPAEVPMTLDEHLVLHPGGGGRSRLLLATSDAAGIRLSPNGHLDGELLGVVRAALAHCHIAGCAPYPSLYQLLQEALWIFVQVLLHGARHFRLYQRFQEGTNHV